MTISMDVPEPTCGLNPKSEYRMPSNHVDTIQTALFNYLLQELEVGEDSEKAEIVYKTARDWVALCPKKRVITFWDIQQISFFVLKSLSYIVLNAAVALLCLKYLI